MVYLVMQPSTAAPAEGRSARELSRAQLDKIVPPKKDALDNVLEVCAAPCFHLAASHCLHLAASHCLYASTLLPLTASTLLPLTASMSLPCCLSLPPPCCLYHLHLHLTAAHYLLIAANRCLTDETKVSLPLQEATR